MFEVSETGHLAGVLCKAGPNVPEGAAASDRCALACNSSFVLCCVVLCCVVAAAPSAVTTGQSTFLRAAQATVLMTSEAVAEGVWGSGVGGVVQTL